MKINDCINKSLKQVLFCENQNIQDDQEFEFVADMFDDVGGKLVFVGKLKNSQIKFPEELVIPEEFEEKKVIAIGQSALANSSIIKVTLPKTIEEIYKYAFSNCLKLEEVIGLDENIKAIGEGAFFNCGALNEINLPKGIEKIPQACFSNCSALTKVTIPESVKTIEFRAFEKCAALKSIETNAKTIGSNAFAFCSELESVKLSGISFIGNYAFNACKNLKELVFSDSLDFIDNRAFYNCGSLKEIVIPDSTTVIGAGAFEECGSLTNITLPSTVKVGDQAFGHCPLKKVNNLELPEVIINMITG